MTSFGFKYFKESYFKDSFIMQVKQETSGIFHFETSLADEEFQIKDFNRRGRKHLSIEEGIVPIRNTLNNISTKKNYHLQKLLELLPRRFHNVSIPWSIIKPYRKIVVSACKRNINFVY